MVGHDGSNPVIDAVLQPMTKKAVYLGSAGAGNATKAVNNLLNVTHLVIATECLKGLATAGISVRAAAFWCILWQASALPVLLVS